MESKNADLAELSRALAWKGSSRRAETGARAADSHEPADVVLLDIDRRDRGGLNVVRSIRELSTVPIVVATARESELDPVLTLEAGADDYVVKPYHIGELMARIEAAIRSSELSARSTGAIEYGPLHIDDASRQVRLYERRIELTFKEFDLLYLLASNAGAVVPRERIMQEIWDNSWSRRTVDTHVCTIRSKLGSSDWVLNVRGVGYRMGIA
ncbi:response regulator transcription factor [Nocardia sp. NPDC101769]|uniref:response regulator transcription factor n=1 Tax=Nocardia sp. NPDC101769 TaxID=3364333 RepID=UPI003801009A